MKSTLILMCFLLSNALSAQTVYFINAGTIEFEKTINTNALIKKELNKKELMVIEQNTFEEYQRTQPQFKLMQSSLSFVNDKTLFTPIPESGRPDVFRKNPAVLQSNIIYTDHKENSSIIQKNILGKNFLVKDAPRKIAWKITAETREISGYACRRANAIIMDSIYVVAFYTDEILTEGGPESFNGLPGMILGVVLPHDNISWFAKKITIQPAVTELKPPIKGKAINNNELRSMVDALNKNSTRPLDLQSVMKYLLL